VLEKKTASLLKAMEVKETDKEKLRTRCARLARILEQHEIDVHEEERRLGRGEELSVKAGIRDLLKPPVEPEPEFEPGTEPEATSAPTGPCRAEEFLTALQKEIVMQKWWESKDEANGELNDDDWTEPHEEEPHEEVPDEEVPVEHTEDQATLEAAGIIVDGLRKHFDEACPKDERLDGEGLARALHACFRDVAVCGKVKAKGKKAIDNAIAKSLMSFHYATFRIFLNMICCSAMNMDLREEVAAEIRLQASEM